MPKNMSRKGTENISRYIFLFCFVSKVPIIQQLSSRRVWTPKSRGNFDPTDKLLKDIEDYHRLQSPNLKNVGGISMDNRL